MALDKSLADAVVRLAADGFVAYPTETVWGLGACADRSVAIDRLRRWKRRPSDAPLTLLVTSADSAVEIGCQMDDRTMRLARSFWPGPLTLVVACRGRFAPGVARADGAVGLRCSSHPLAHALAMAVRDAGLAPLTSTSLNRSGEDPALDRAAAEAMIRGDRKEDLASPLLLHAPGADAGGKLPSSVLDCTGSLPKIVRVGAIESASLEEFWTQ